MEKVILSQNKHWNKPYSELYDRDIFPDLVKKLDVKHIQVLQGIRRSGNTILNLNHTSIYNLHSAIISNGKSNQNNQTRYT